MARGSILIAAHNEAGTLPACLGPLRHAIDAGDYELVVVSNGSTDGTEAVAARILTDAPLSSVITLDEASKAAALRAGDDHLAGFPRAYLDADIVIDEPTLNAMFDALRAHPDPRVSAPALNLDTSSSTRIVQAYYSVWLQMPYIADGVVGVGVYAVNEPGWNRLGTFPGLLNDDEWVARHFAADERLKADGQFVARAARNLPALLRQRARVEQGNRELATESQMVQQSTSLSDVLAGVRARRFGPFDAACFVFVVVATRVLAAWRRKRGSARNWSTDLTSRTGGTHG